MKWFVLLNAALEIIAGVVFLFFPQLVPGVNPEDANSAVLCRMYGAAALALGWYALLVFLNFREGPFRGFLKTFIVFHLGVALASFHGVQAGLDTFNGPLGLHGLLGLACLIILFTRRQPLA